MSTTDVTTAASAIFSVTPDNVFVLKNAGPATVFLDTNSAVTADQTSTGGYPLAPGEAGTVPAIFGNNTNPYTLYGITAQGDAYVSYMAF